MSKNVLKYSPDRSDSQMFGGLKCTNENWFVVLDKGHRFLLEVYI